MRVRSRIARILVVGLIVACATAGCGSKLKWRVVGPLDTESPAIGPLRVEVTPVDAAELEKGHPFRWRGSKTAGFMLFDVRITNTGTDDLLCQVGHLDFPGIVSPQSTLEHILTGVPSAPGSSEQELVSTADLCLTALTHEKATILMNSGHRYQLLSYADFAARYMYLMQKELRQAFGFRFVPYVGPFIASAKTHNANKRMPERLMQAQQMVMRPGVVPAGTTIRGYLVFGWPPDCEVGPLTLRLPVQPAHAASARFDLVRRD